MATSRGKSAEALRALRKKYGLGEFRKSKGAKKITSAAKAAVASARKRVYAPRSNKVAGGSNAVYDIPIVGGSQAQGGRMAITEPSPQTVFPPSRPPMKPPVLR